MKGKRKLVPWLFLAPSLGGTLLFTGIPFVDVVKRSFQDAMGTRFMGMENYKAVLANPAFCLAAGNTFRFQAVCIPLLMAVSFSLALLIFVGGIRADDGGRERYGKGREKKGRKEALDSCDYGGFRTILVLPMTIPAASMVLIWRILLCPEGVLNQLLSEITTYSWEIDWVLSERAFPILIVTYLWKHTGYDMILWLAGLQGIPGELYEAAKMDGAGSVARLWYITLPGLKGTFGLVGILSVVNSFRVYREAYLLAGSYPDSSIYLIPHLFAHWFLSLDIQKMTAAAVMMTGIFLILAAAVWGWRMRERRMV